MVMPYHLHMPSYFLETFTEYPDLFLFFQCCENQTFQFFRQFGVVLNHLFGGVTSLSQFGFVVAVP